MLDPIPVCSGTQHADPITFALHTCSVFQFMTQCFEMLALLTKQYVPVLYNIERMNNLLHHKGQY